MIRVGLEGIPPWTGVALRFAIAGAVLGLAARFLGIGLGPVDARLRRLWLINTLFTFCIPYGVTYWAEQWLPSGLTALLFATYPLFVTVLAHLRLPAERMRPVAAVGIMTGFLGVALIYSEDLAALGGERVPLAAAVFLLSPAASALASVEVKRLGAGVPALALTAPPMLFTAMIMTPLALRLEADRGLNVDATALAALLYLALFGSAVAFGLYFWLLARLPATRLALVAYAVPLVALAVGVVALDERLTVRILIGAALVLLGVAAAMRSPSRPAADRRSDEATDVCRDAS